MKTFIYDLLNKVKRTNDALDTKAILCNKCWRVFSDSCEKEVYIFTEDGTLVISIDGKAIMGKWIYIAANRALLLTGNEQHFLVHPIICNNVLALVVDGTKQCSFLIDETESELAMTKSLQSLLAYVEINANKLPSGLMQPNLQLTSTDDSFTTFDVIENGFNYKRVCVDGFNIDFSLVRSGTFAMGRRKTFMDVINNLDSCWPYHNPWPVHEVHVDTFYISKYKVTQDLFKHIMGKLFMEDNDKTLLNPRYPAQFKKYENAVEFIRKINLRLEKGIFRLPTEAEWEFAARERDTSKFKYSGSNKLEEIGGNLSYSNLQSVGSFKPNSLGIYDMSSMLLECCSDWLSPYKSGYQDNPQGPSEGIIFPGSHHTQKIIRGGSNMYISQTVYDRWYVDYPYPSEYNQNENQLCNNSIRLIYEETI